MAPVRAEGTTTRPDATDMTLPRRDFLAVASTIAIAPLAVPWSVTATETASTMYGLIGKMTAVAGQRDALAVPAVITKAKPLIAGFSNRVETVPIGGYGLGKTAVP
jgi:hypothetical protein